MYSWLIDLVTASSLTLLYSIAGTDLPWASISSILLTASVFYWAAGFQVKRLRLLGCYDYTLDFIYDSVKIVLNLATLLTQAKQSDSKLGPALYVAPIFTLICLPGAMTLSYETTMRQTAAWSSAVLVVISIFMLLKMENNVYTDNILFGEVQSYMQIFLAALSSSDLNEAHLLSWSVTMRRTVIYLLLASNRAFVTTFLQGSANLMLWFLHGIVLLQSCLLLTRRLRQHAGKINVKDPGRFCILINMLLLTAAYSWRENVAYWGAGASSLLFAISMVKLAMDICPLTYS